MNTDAFATELAELGASLNSTLNQTIATASPEVVEDAIAALREAREFDTIERPGGWLKRAIEEQWKPNRVTVRSQLLFNQWFPLARAQGIAIASTQTEAGELLVFDADCQPHPFPQMLARYPLETLQTQQNLHLRRLHETDPSSTTIAHKSAMQADSMDRRPR
ncbi:MAG: hypothetical protein MUF49_11395 [Oculatellaceae cyanobacterium Prado106]|jgi:hypothetical protein|nr:hypothetical protein [Oculatellaceae cyanobacterium Prado106]